jgi:hypothetical protein
LTGRPVVEDGSWFRETPIDRPSNEKILTPAAGLALQALTL